MSPQTPPRLFTFSGGDAGPWRVTGMRAVAGEELEFVEKVNVISGPPRAATQGVRWQLRGITSNDRYVTRSEKKELVAKQQGLGRREATCAALIPMRKSAAWWALTQEERRRIFEEDSQHIAIGLKYLPAIARRLHHCRDLLENEPFDFLTWFEYAPAESMAFENLVAELRATEEWKFVDREVDIRLTRDQ